MDQKNFQQNRSLSAPNRLRLALTLGDPSGVGPEVILKALANPEINKNCDLVVVGSASFLFATYESLVKLVGNQTATIANPTNLSIIDIPVTGEIIAGISNAVSGTASFAFMEYAIAQTLAGKFAGIVTGPIAKSAWKAAGHDYPGQTELLATKSGVKDVGMLFVGRSPITGWVMRTLLATTHIPLRQVADTITPELLSRKLNLLVKCLEQDFGIVKGKIAIAGLNPHSGEMGQLGREEIDWIVPWVTSQQQKYPDFHLVGPVPPDTIWVKAGQAWYGNGGEQNPADAYLALYHDQGLIPVKLMAFDRAVNTSIGLPFVRTSPDHGTAFDIAGKGIADPTSMIAAINLAIDLVKGKREIPIIEN
jgi:4-hydroxythreonine-4-phosphate dehydrogenase